MIRGQINLASGEKITGLRCARFGVVRRGTSGPKHQVIHLGTGYWVAKTRKHRTAYQIALRLDSQPGWDFSNSTLPANMEQLKQQVYEASKDVAELDDNIAGYRLRYWPGGDARS